MEENLEDAVLVLQVVRIHLMAGYEFGKQQLADVQLILDHLVFVKMRILDGLIDAVKYLKIGRGLDLVKMEHGNGTENVHPDGVFERTIVCKEFVEVVFLYEQVDR